MTAIYTSVIRHLSHEKQFDSLGGWSGPGWWGGPSGNWGNTRVTSSTIEVGKLVIGMFDPASKQLVWRGSASKTLDIKKDPDKNYRNLEKAIAKLFRNYPRARARAKALLRAETKKHDPHCLGVGRTCIEPKGDLDLAQRLKSSQLLHGHRTRSRNADLLGRARNLGRSNAAIRGWS